MKKVFTIFFVFAIIIITASLAVFSFYQQAVNSPGPNQKDKQFKIEAGQTVAQISQNLYQAGLINSKLFFQAFVWSHNLESRLQAGEYQIPARASIKQLTEILAQGKVINKEVTIKIIEGWRLTQIADYLEKKGLVKAKDFLAVCGVGQGNVVDPEFVKNFSFLADKPEQASLEGYLFPDTYRVYKDAGAKDIVFKMLANFSQKVDDDLLAAIKEQGKSLYEVITLASIVEKEVRSADDMKIVAGIFQKRLKSGQPLQSCATLAYILGVNKPQYSLADTKISSPYNTYLHPGLPPGPICNPSLQAIKAVVWPAKTEYNYFLTNPADGSTVFSRTYQEHLKNKAKYLR